MYWLIGYLVIGFFVSLASLASLYNEKRRPSYPAWQWFLVGVGILLLWPVLPLIRWIG
jgi:hypothetical protein